MTTFLLVIGTRPEAIKIAPLYLELKKSKSNKVYLLTTGQHKEMVYQVLDFFSIKPDYDLGLMRKNQNHIDLLARILSGVNKIVSKTKPNYIVVQGDTSTVLGASIVSFLNKIKLVHLEAGLRSFNMLEPFPEEMNRVITSKISDIHLAPTKAALKNLLNEGIPKNKIHLVGNTVIDALLYGNHILSKKHMIKDLTKQFSFLGNGKKTILLTCHRRENFGLPLRNILEIVKKIAEQRHDSVNICFPVHPNPNVKKVVYELLNSIPNVFLFQPVSYPELIFLMNRSYFILTDSGGIQEEAPTFGKPVLVLRNVSERMEGVEAGNAKLVGTNKNLIFSELTKLLDDKEYYKSFSKANNPYGNGKASKMIAQLFNEKK